LSILSIGFIKKARSQKENLASEEGDEKIYPNRVNEYLGFLPEDSLNNYRGIVAEIKHFFVIF
jgi:hypothetical protein